MAIPGNKDVRDGILVSIPYVLVFSTFMLYPICFGLFISFFKWDILSGREFIGLGNYITLFSDKIFYSSLWHTLQFVLITTPLLMIIGFAMALFVCSKSKLKDMAENIFFIPYVLSITVIGTLWAWLFQRNFGLFNQLFLHFGLEKVGWLTNPSLAMWSVAAATIWWTAGFNMILFSAGIKQISGEIYESAEIDGAGYWQNLFYITIPMIKSTTVLCLILQIIASFQVFGQVFVMTGGGPYGKTRVLIQYIYESGFSYFKMGYSSAMSYVLFLLIMIVSFVNYKLTGKGAS